MLGEHTLSVVLCSSSVVVRLLGSLLCCDALCSAIYALCPFCVSGFAGTSHGSLEELFHMVALPASLLHTCCRHRGLLGCHSPLLLYEAAAYPRENLMERNDVYQPPGFWFTYGRASMFKDYKNTGTCFFCYFCGFVFTSNCTFSENYSRAV